MARKHLRSDLSEQEARFFTQGRLFVGDANAITGLIKIIGKYTELKRLNRGQEIGGYNPDADNHYKYENYGYSILGGVLNRKFSEPGFSRKYVKNLSRVWCLTPIIISFNSDRIIKELFTFINDDTKLKEACNNYLLIKGAKWNNLMPIQADFLSTRHADQHKDFRIAGRLINELSKISL